METSHYIGDILIENRNNVYLGLQTMKEAPSPESSNRDANVSKLALKDAEPTTLVEHKEKKEEGNQVEQSRIWELYKEKSLRSNLWKLFIESYINEHKLLQIHKSLESEQESTLIMDLAIAWSRFVRTIILPAIGLFFWQERETISSLNKEGLDPHLIDNKNTEKNEQSL